MMRAKQRIKDFFDTHYRNFNEYRSEIAIRNLQLIRMTCIIGSCLFAAYYIVTTVFFSSWAISPLYALIVPALLMFLPFVSRASRTERIDVKGIMRAAYLLYLVLMCYLIILSVFPHPDVPSVYFPLFVLIAPVIFVLPINLHIITTIVSYVVFCVLVVCFKSRVCWSHELFEATTASVFAIVIAFFMSQFRVQTNQSTEKYFKMSRTDGLTGLLNKTAGLSIMESYTLGARGESYAVLFLDIDRFKDINDTYGHLEGDGLLRTIGERLTDMFRKGDVLCRFGGDEFLILMKDVHSEKYAREKASDIIKTLRELGEAHPYTLTCSIGIYLSETHKDDLDEVLLRADKALYQAKSRGRNRYHVYRGEGENDKIAEEE